MGSVRLKRKDDAVQRAADRGWSRLDWDERLAIETLVRQQIAVAAVVSFIMGIVLGGLAFGLT